MRERKQNLQTAVSAAENEKLPRWFGLAWSSRGVSAALNVVLVAYVTFYCTDMLGMSAGLIGTLLLASKIFDGVTDLIVGFIIDKTRTKWGKARPYEIFIVFQWIFTVMLFSTPDIGIKGQAVYVFIMYCLIGAVCTTFLGGCDSVYMARAIRSEKNRISVISINGVVVMFCSIVFNILFPQIIAVLGTTRQGWTKIALFMAVPLILIGMLRFLLIKEVADDENTNKDNSGETEKASFKDMLKAIAKNKFIFIIFGLMLLTQISNGFATGVTTYYFKYVMGDVRLMSMASMTNLVTPLLLILFPMFSRKIGTTNILRVATAMGIAGLLIRSVFGANMPAIIVGGLLAGIGTMPLSMMINTYLIDCMDYGEWKTGIRVEGLVASVVNFATKVGGGIASGLIGLIMGLAGYDGAAQIQSSSAMTSIVALYNYIPLLLFVIMMVLAMLYKMDKVMPQVRDDLKERHKGRE